MGRVLNHLKQHAIAYAALFVALGTGTAYAANTVFSTDIVDNEIRSVDVRDNELQSVDVRNNTLTGDDVNESTLQGIPHGTTFFRGMSVSPGQQGTISIPGSAAITYTCPVNHLTTDGTIAFQNPFSKGMDLWVDEGGNDPLYDRLPPGRSRSTSSSFSGDRVVYSYQVDGPGSASFWGTISVDSVPKPEIGYPPTCVVQIQALLSS
jgi:hypothetical protein